MRYSTNPYVDSAYCIYYYLGAYRDRLLELFGDEQWLHATGAELKTFLQRLDDILQSSNTITFESMVACKPDVVSDEMLVRFVTRWNASIENWLQNGNTSQVEGLIDAVQFAKHSETMADIVEYVQSLGYESLQDYFNQMYQQKKAEYEQLQEEVCASVKLELSEGRAACDGAPLASAVLAFGDVVMAEDIVVGKFSLTRNGTPVALGDAVLSSTDDRTFVLSGLDAVTAEDGAYVLTFDGVAVRKRSSGLFLGRSVVLRWTYASPDRTPPEVTAVLFDGEVPNAA